MFEKSKRGLFGNKKEKKEKKSMAIIDGVGVHDVKALERMYRTKQV